MAESFKLPFHYVNLLRKPGLRCDAGPVALRQYLCKTRSNGGNDSANSLYKNLRWLPKDGSGPNMDSVIGRSRIELALKGQGSHDTFIDIWNFMLKNKHLLDMYKVEVCGRAGKDGSKNVSKRGTIKSLYFDRMSDWAALQQMVDDRFFGMDCIGFVSNFLIWVGELSQYPNVSPKKFPTHICKINIDDIDEVKPLDFMVWNGHVALVDWVWSKTGDNTILIDMAQSSTDEQAGPQLNSKVTLKQTKQKGGVGGKRLFGIEGGSPRPPVKNHMTIWRREGFWY